jgi:hypothetical protein
MLPSIMGAFPPGTIIGERLESGVSVGSTGVGVGVEVGVGVIPVDRVAAVVLVIDPAGTQLAKNTNAITVKIIILLRIMNIVLRITVSPRCSLVK